MRTNFLILTITILIASLFLSCVDDPNSVGNALIPPEDKLANKTIDSYSSAFEQSSESFEVDTLFFGTSTRLLLGKHDNLKSDLFLKFLIQLDDSIKEQFDSKKISLSSSWIEMYPNYWIGDSTFLDFSVHKLNTSWNPIDIDDKNLDEMYSNKGPNIFIPSSLSYTDSVIRFEIDQDLVESWVRGSYDDSITDFYGILLEPTVANGIAGFQGLTNLPSNKYITLHLLFEKDGNIIDTVLATPNLDLHVPSGEKPIDPDGSIILQSSLAIRSKMKMDLSSVPTNIIINKATLDIFTDEDNSLVGTIESDSLILSLLSTYDIAEINTKYSKKSLIKNDSIYTGDITQFVQLWINGTEENEGLEIKISDENRSASKISFFNSTNALESLRPRLTIYYTTR